MSVLLRQQWTGDRNQACDHPFSWVLGAAQRHDGSLATRCSPVEGRRSPRPTATRSRGLLAPVGKRAARTDVFTNRAAGIAPWSAWYSEDIEIRKHRIPSNRVLRRCQDTGQERTPVARAHPREPRHFSGGGVSRFGRLFSVRAPWLETPPRGTIRVGPSVKEHPATAPGATGRFPGVPRRGRSGVGIRSPRRNGSRRIRPPRSASGPGGRSSSAGP